MARLESSIFKLIFLYKKILKVIQYPSRTKLPDFVLSEIKWAKHQFVYAAGKWDQLTVRFFLTRQFGVYLIQMYFPVETVNFFIFK